MRSAQHCATLDVRSVTESLRGRFGAVSRKGTRWSGTRWSGARWSGTRWSGTRWSGTRWSGADWS